MSAVFAYVTLIHRIPITNALERTQKFAHQKHTRACWTAIHKAAASTAAADFYIDIGL